MVQPFAFLCILSALAGSAVMVQAAEVSPKFVGSAACGTCHREIAGKQSISNMAVTLKTADARALPGGAVEKKDEGPIQYETVSKAGRLDWRVAMPEQSPVSIPVEEVVGGTRHGISFLTRLTAVGGIQLERAPLIEARYLHSSTEEHLVLSPGFPSQLPASLESGIGRVLSTKFEKKCLSCHGAPGGDGLNEAGVHCESCHGPGQSHLLAVGRGKPREGILNPARLTNEKSIEVCARCHSGFTPVTDPLPDDLLISSQATAIRNTECFIQSGAGFSCTSCHNPHQNARENEAAYTETCLRCHSAGLQKRAALCPVNQNDGCIGCHMPTRRRGPFQMADHWIRVMGDADRQPAHTDNLQSRVTPVRLFLRVLTVKDRAAADNLQKQIAGGASFFELAVKHSVDPSASNGGYLGEVKVAEMDAALRDAVVRLRPGGISSVVTRGDGYKILGRMPRDFRWKAGEVAEQATSLRNAGKLEDATAKYLDALRLYPNLLRAIILLGVTEGQLGKAQQAYGILDLAAQLYPSDPAAHYNLGIALEAMGRQAEGVDAYRRAISLEPDLLPAYLNLGGALFSAGQTDAAVEAYRKGIDVNPLAAELYYNLATVLTQQGKSGEAKRAMKVATAINPKFVASQSAGQ